MPRLPNVYAHVWCPHYAKGDFPLSSHHCMAIEPQRPIETTLWGSPTELRIGRRNMKSVLFLVSTDTKTESLWHIDDCMSFVNHLCPPSRRIRMIKSSINSQLLTHFTLYIFGLFFILFWSLKTPSKSSPKICFFFNRLFRGHRTHPNIAAKSLSKDARGYFGLYFSVVWSVSGR